METTRFDSAPDLYESVRQALRLWHDTGNSNPLTHLLAFQSSCGSEGIRKVVNTQLLKALEELATSHADEARLLRMRYLDSMTAETVAYRLGMSIPNLNKKQKKAIYALADLLVRQEQEQRTAQQATFLARLEVPTYDHLFGIEYIFKDLVQLLAPTADPWLIALEGIGGIGKTSLADALMRQAIAQHQFAGFGWVSARAQRFQLAGAIHPLRQSALTSDSLLEQLATQILGHSEYPMPVVGTEILARLSAYLRETPHLIVVDNLETMADLEVLLPTLKQLANPSKFLLTSRMSLHNEVPTYTYKIPPLCETDALALLRYEATLRNQPTVAQADDAQLRPVYATVGGNPLALRLIIGQTRIHALDVILANLQEARGQAVEKLYTYIYRYAWDHLGDPTRRAFIAMPFATELGATIDQLADISKLDATDLRDALQLLVSLNLVNRQGNLTESRYTIHSLTRTFLLKQVVQWMV